MDVVEIHSPCPERGEEEEGRGGKGKREEENRYKDIVGEKGRKRKKG